MQSQSPQILEPSAGGATTKPRVIGFTLRISNIPITFTKDQVFRKLNDLRSSESQQEVFGSFAPSPISSDSVRRMTATVTFGSPHPLIPKSLFGNEVIVDSHFHGLTPLNAPIGQPLVDIIAVTGLAGHAFGSWKSRGHNMMWLRDLLPEHVPKARILTYGYDSELLKNSNASICDFSHNFLQALKTARESDEEKFRPIIFIGHSLGGIVIKSALCTAYTASSKGDDEESGFIYSSCHALLLFGVPHTGLKDESLHTMVKGQPRARLVNDLMDNSDFLRTLNQFWESTNVKVIRVVSIYETRPTPTVQETPAGWKRIGPEVLIVSRSSATYATQIQNRIKDTFSIDANHSDIVKFNTGVCEAFELVRKKIVELVKDAENISLKLKAFIPFCGLAREKKRAKILKWVSKIEYITHHQNAKGGLLEGTGQWLLQNEQYRKWRVSKKSGILWLHGIPGAGKTKLTCMVIDTLESKAFHDVSQQVPEPVVYFYCDRAEPLRRDPKTIMRTLLRQLSAVHQYWLPKQVVRGYEKKGGTGVLGTLDSQECLDAIISLLGVYTQTSIIIDALDESDPKERYQLLEALQAMMQLSTSLVKIFISSRDDTDITLRLEHVPNLYIGAADNGNDIERFVRREVEKSISNKWLLCGYVPDSLREEIISTIIAKANGMFQWADLQIKHLCEMEFEEDIIENLGSLPKTLEETYAQIYTSILSARPRAQNITKKAFMWLLYSRKLFDREEWAYFSYWPQNVPEHGVPSLFKLCYNLVTWDSQSCVVRFAHLSVREYLESKYTPIDGNTMATECCLSLLDPPTAGLVPFTVSEEAARYATTYWPHHVEDSCDRNIDKQVLELLQRFLGTPSKPGRGYCKWQQDTTTLLHERVTYSRYTLQAYNFIHVKSTPPNPLFAISYFRFGEELHDKWEWDSVDIDSKNDEGETLLFVASMQGRKSLISHLLQKGADINAGSSKYAINPFLAAVRGGQDSVAVQLLDAGACIADGAYLSDVLEEVAYIGSKPAMEILLSRDFCVNVTVGVVTAASNINGGKEVMKLLVSTPATKITTAAVVAISREFDRTTIELLLSRDNIEISEHVLTAIVHRFNREIVEPMLAKSSTRITEDILVAVAGNTNCGKDTIEMLLARDKDMEISQEVLKAAAGNSYSGEAIMEVLLARDPIIQVTEAVLVAAAGNSYSGENIMRLLLDTGATIEVTKAVVRAAAVNWYSGDAIIALLYRRATTEGKSLIKLLYSKNTDNPTHGTTRNPLLPRLTPLPPKYSPIGQNRALALSPWASSTGHPLINIPSPPEYNYFEQSKALGFPWGLESTGHVPTANELPDGNYRQYPIVETNNLCPAPQQVFRQVDRSSENIPSLYPTARPTTVRSVSD